MVFSSTTFLFYFLPSVFIVVGIAYVLLRPILGKKGVTTVINTILFAFSLLFYYWGEGTKTWILALSIATTFSSGLLVARKPTSNSRVISQTGLALGIGSNLGLLLWFKYSNFGYSTLQKLLAFFGSTANENLLQIALPLGISFYTFQSISYILDVYWKKTPPCKNLIDFGCYITFFPQLVAGPIVRFKDIQTNLEQRNINIDSISAGASRFIIGLSKKVLIANPTGRLADDLFAMQASSLSTFGCWLAALSYAIQILFDFSGYSDMAIGLAQIFGIRIPENFNSPYRSTSMRQFWRNWHISLSSWFRDYLYIPLGGNRTSSTRTFLNLFIVFLACGLWHGASINFALWGIFHGVFLCSEHFINPQKSNKFQYLQTIAGRIYTTAVVLTAWILFRTESTDQAASFYHSMFINIEGTRNANLPISFYSLETQIALLAGLAIAFIPSPIKAQMESKAWFQLIKKPILLGLLSLSATYIAISSYNPFIYFRF